MVIVKIVTIQYAPLVKILQHSVFNHVNLIVKLVIHLISVILVELVFI